MGGETKMEGVRGGGVCVSWSQADMCSSHECTFPSWVCVHICLTGSDKESSPWGNTLLSVFRQIVGEILLGWEYSGTSRAIKVCFDIEWRSTSLHFGFKFAFVSLSAPSSPCLPPLFYGFIIRSIKFCDKSFGSYAVRNISQPDSKLASLALVIKQKSCWIVHLYSQLFRCCLAAFKYLWQASFSFFHMTKWCVFWQEATLNEFVALPCRAFSKWSC